MFESGQFNTVPYDSPHLLRDSDLVLRRFQVHILVYSRLLEHAPQNPG